MKEIVIKNQNDAESFLKDGIYVFEGNVTFECNFETKRSINTTGFISIKAGGSIFSFSF